MDAKGLTGKEQSVNDDPPNYSFSEKLPNSDVMKELPQNDSMKSPGSLEQHEKFRECCQVVDVCNDADDTAERLQRSREDSVVIGLDSNSTKLSGGRNERELLSETLSNFPQDEGYLKAPQDVEVAFPTSKNQDLHDGFNSNDLTLKQFEKVDKEIDAEKTQSKDSEVLCPENRNELGSSFEDKSDVFQIKNLNSCKKIESIPFTEEIDVVRTLPGSVQLCQTVNREGKNKPLIAPRENVILFSEAFEKGEDLAQKNESTDNACYELDGSESSVRSIESKSRSQEDVGERGTGSVQLCQTVNREGKNKPPSAPYENVILFCEAFEKGEDLARKNKSIEDEVGSKKSVNDNVELLTKQVSNTEYKDNKEQDNGNSKFLDPIVDGKILNDTLNKTETQLQQIDNTVKLDHSQSQEVSTTEDNKDNNEIVEQNIDKSLVELKDSNSPRFESCEVLTLEIDRKDLKVEGSSLYQSDEVFMNSSATVSDLLSVTTKEERLRELSYNACYELDGNECSERSRESKPRLQEDVGERETETVPKILAETSGTSNVFLTNTSIIGNNHEVEGLEKNSMEVDDSTCPKFECEETNLAQDKKNLNDEHQPQYQSDDVNLKSRAKVSDTLSTPAIEDSFKEHSYCASFESGGNTVPRFTCISDGSRETYSSSEEETIDKIETDAVPKIIAKISGMSNVSHTNGSANKNHDNTETLFSEFSEGDLDFTIEINKEFEISEVNCPNSELLQKFNTSQNEKMPTSHSLETLNTNPVQPVECFPNLSSVEFRRDQIFHDHRYSLISKETIAVIAHDHTYSIDAYTNDCLNPRSNLTVHTKVGPIIIHKAPEPVDKRNDTYTKEEPIRIHKALETVDKRNDTHTMEGPILIYKTPESVYKRHNTHTIEGPIRMYKAPDTVEKRNDTHVVIHRQTEINEKFHTQPKPQTTNPGPLVVYNPKTTRRDLDKATTPSFFAQTEANKEKLFLKTKTGILSVQTVLHRAETSKNTQHQLKVDNPNKCGNISDNFSVSYQGKETMGNVKSSMLKSIHMPTPKPAETRTSGGSGLIVQHVRRYVHDSKSGTVSEEKISESFMLQSEHDKPKPYKTLVVKKTYCDDSPEECNENKEDNRKGRLDLFHGYAKTFSVKGVPPNNCFQKYQANRQPYYPSQDAENMVYPEKKPRYFSVIHPQERVVSLLDGQTKPSIIQTIIPDVKIPEATDGSYFSRIKQLLPLRKFYHISKKSLKEKFLVVERADGCCYFKKLYSPEIKDGVYLEVMYETDDIFAEYIAKQLQDPSFEITENVPFTKNRRCCNQKTPEAEKTIFRKETLNHESEEDVETLKKIAGDPVKTKLPKNRKPCTEIPRLQKIKERCKKMMWREGLRMYTIPIDEVDFWSWPTNFYDPWDDPKLRKFSRVVLKSLSLENMHLKGIDARCSKSCRQDIVCMSLNAKIRKLRRERKRICREFEIPLRRVSLPKNNDSVFLDKENALNIEMNVFKTSEGVCIPAAKELENECSGSEKVQSLCESGRELSISSGFVFSEEQNENMFNMQTINEIKTESRSENETSPLFEKAYEIPQENQWNLVAVKEEPVSQGYGDESVDCKVRSRQEELLEQIEYVRDEPISGGCAQYLGSVQSSNSRKRCFSEYEIDNDGQGLSFVDQDMLNYKLEQEMDVAARHTQIQSSGPSPNKIPAINPSENLGFGNYDDYSSEMIPQIKIENVNVTHATNENIEAEAGVEDRINNFRTFLKQCEKKICALKETMTFEDKN
ncbi:uncharacterized protein LOC134247890 [Saccostrea cucullata]|uniref:uncharacterized protein LOC134247890 n=1 Tax=Saccostrea cuccullata TaxID=36930 RepID=UPI002ED103B1